LPFPRMVWAGYFSSTIKFDSCRPLTVLVRHLGHTGDYITSGTAALEYLGKILPDILILDVMMPGMDGMEVLQRLRADPRYAKLRVVMFSAMDGQGVRRRAFDLGANDYWVKASMGFELLGERLDALLSPTPGCKIHDHDGTGLAGA
jgi:CheY-like chemotaxis protein